MKEARYKMSHISWFHFCDMSGTDKSIESICRLWELGLEGIGTNWEGLMLKLNLQYFGHLMWRTDSLEKSLMMEKIEGKRRREWQRMRWLDHQLNGCEFEQTLGESGGQRSLACCSPWGHKESDKTAWLNNHSSKDDQSSLEREHEGLCFRKSSWGSRDLDLGLG